MSSADPLHELGARITADGGQVRVYSATATAIELCLFSSKDPNWVTDTIPLEADAGNVWSAASPKLVAGSNYTLRASGPARATGRAARPSRFVDRAVAKSATACWPSGA